jgi:hypothetical protein
VRPQPESTLNAFILVARVLQRRAHQAAIRRVWTVPRQEVQRFRFVFIGPENTEKKRGDGKSLVRTKGVVFLVWLSNEYVNESAGVLGLSFEPRRRAMALLSKANYELKP